MQPRKDHAFVVYKKKFMDIALNRLQCTLKYGNIPLTRMKGGEKMQVRQYDLKQIRALLNMTQPQLAKLLNVHRNTIGNLEKHPERIDLSQAWILAEAAGIGIEQIKIEREGENKCNQPA